VQCPLAPKGQDGVHDEAGVALGGLVENPHYFTGEALPEMARVQAKQTNVEETDHQASLGFAFAKRRRASRNTTSRRATSPESTECPRGLKR